MDHRSDDQRNHRDQRGDRPAPRAADDGEVEFTERARRAVQQMIGVLLDRGLTVATAESLTGGLASYLVVDEPDSGQVHLGGVVAYASEVKRSVLGVSDGPVVTDRCASEMAAGVQALLGADCALAFTGVAGPTTQEGAPVGTVFVAARVGTRSDVREHHFEGSPVEIRAQAIEHATALVCTLVRSTGDGQATGAAR